MAQSAGPVWVLQTENPLGFVGGEEEMMQLGEIKLYSALGLRDERENITK